MLELKADLVTRIDVVLEEWELKGGDVTGARQYVSALSGVVVGVTDASTLWEVVKRWIVSEEGGQHWFWNIVRFLFILFLFYFGAAVVAGFVGRAMKRVPGVSQLLVKFLERFIKQALMIVGLIVALTALEIDITPLLAAVGAAGFVIGFALQDTLSNFASGMLILAYRPFDEGHWIEAAGVSGQVDSVSLFSTKVRTPDNKVMIVPNNDIWGGTITNSSASATRRVDLVFGIGYGDDIEKAVSIMEKILQEHELVMSDPEPTIRVNELADSSVNFICRPWTRTPDYWTVYWDVTRTVKERFDAAGISIPFPQQDIHVYKSIEAE